MAIDPEEYRQRRMQREQRRQNQYRKTIVKLILAGVALVLCGFLIFLFTRPGQTETPSDTTALTQNTTGQAGPSAPSDPSAAATESTEPTQPTPATTVIHLAAAGDLNVNGSVVDANGAAYDYSQTFLDVSHLLSGADASMLNFEGNFCGTPYGNTGSAPNTLAEALDQAGVDFLQLANSYSINFGMSGLSDTIDQVRSAGMEPLGVYADQAEYEEGKGYIIRNIQGVKVAFVAFTKGMNGLALPAGNENCVNVLYTDYASTYQQINTEKITAVLEAIEEEAPDITIAMLHWGSEGNDTISESQEEVRDLLLENGVDAILGTHSHILQKMEYDPAAGTFVAYSLGDFFGSYSVILDLEITKDHATGQTKITGYSYTPIYTVAEKDKPPRVLRIAEAITAYENGYIDKVSQATYEAMQAALTSIEGRITGE